MLPGQQEKCYNCGKVGHLAAECRGKSDGPEDWNGGDETPIHKKKYQVENMLSCFQRLNTPYLVCPTVSDMMYSVCSFSTFGFYENTCSMNWTFRIHLLRLISSG